MPNPTPTDSQLLNLANALKACAMACPDLTPTQYADLARTTISIDNSLTSCAGRARYQRAPLACTVILSGPIFRKSYFLAQFTDTVLHELAHILSPESLYNHTAHDARWVAAAHLIGCGGERCHAMPRARERAVRAPRTITINDIL